MRGWVIAGVLALGLLLTQTFAGDPPVLSVGEEGLASLDSFLSTVPLTGERQLLGLIGFHGQSQPVQWLILTGTPGSLVEFAFSGGRVLAERKCSPLPGQDLPHLPIERSTLKISSLHAFQIAEAMALARKAAFDCAHYHLRVRENGREPVWMVNLLSAAQTSVGIVYLSATSGEILRETWTHPPGIPEAGISAR